MGGSLFLDVRVEEDEFCVVVVWVLHGCCWGFG